MAANGLRTVAAVLVAAGSGARLGADVPKAFVHVAGRTLLEHAAARFMGHPRIGQVVIAVPAGLVDDARHHVPGATVVAGGGTRQQSVSRALAQLGGDVDGVLVHDVARPFVPAEVIDRVLDAVDSGADGAVPVVAVTDTIRRWDPSSGALGELVDRSRIAGMQTPQGFRRDVLVRAHDRGRELAVTDDVALVEAFGGRVVAVAGDDRAFKITVPFDLLLAEVVAEQSDVADPR